MEIKIMNQITQSRRLWTASPPINQQEYPVIANNGTNYQMVPLQAIEMLKAENLNLKTQNDNLVWLCVGLAAAGSACGLALFVSATKPAQPTITVEKPVIIEREKLVPTACLLFCGK
jgi:hypothetical protein